MTNPDITQKQKRETLENDRKIMSNYLDHANSSVNDERGGRWAAASPTRTVIGTAPAVYPRQPETSPANQAALAGSDEPPLGIDVNAIEPTGELWEQEASRSPGDTSAPPSGVRPSAVERAKALAERQRKHFEESKRKGLRRL
jgi:hypothetical protein